MFKRKFKLSLLEGRDLPTIQGGDIVGMTLLLVEITCAWHRTGLYTPGLTLTTPVRCVDIEIRG